MGYAGRIACRLVVAWDGEQYHPLGPGITDPQAQGVFALSNYNGDLYAGQWTDGGVTGKGGVATNGGNTGSPTKCGGLNPAPCGKNEFCDFDPSTKCGAADQTGVCRAIAEVCTDDYSPVCGCDGKTYSNACEANAKGVSVATQGACE